MEITQNAVTHVGLELRPSPHQNRSPNKKQAYQLAGKFSRPVQRQTPNMAKDVKGEVSICLASLVRNPVVGNTDYSKYQDCLVDNVYPK